ncbi:major facilitator family transporter [Stemphylium lycopersici]|uniref:Major facilitator family transporter n=1 Tax=Stemphylium lycopersici TaxID=183478 RepID=A0A364MYX6_STELY|nr:major facilitator family transporter [Stemphylium lycopersici]
MTSVESPRQGGADETAPSLRTDIISNVERNGTEHEEEQGEQLLWRKIWKVLTWTPPNCRWDPEKPPQFSMSMNVLFAFAAGFTVANLYYNHPILNLFASDFGVRYEQVAQIPTVMQAGYAAGLLFLCPLGDLLPRRPFVCGLVLFTATLWIILCLTNDLGTFTAISFIVAITTVTPQLMLPLVGDLAPPSRRAAALSIVVSGLMLGVLVARVLSGTISNFVTWRAVYWMALALQYLIFVLLWLFMPDYPATNPSMNYFRILLDIVKMLGRHPVLMQACLAGLLTSAPFTSFWTTLTFLLAGPPYGYSSLTIGLFGLIGIAGMLLSPLPCPPGPAYGLWESDRADCKPQCDL